MTHALRWRLWTPEYDADLTRLWADGMSAGVIAKAVGVSTAAVKRRKIYLSLPDRACVRINAKKPKTARATRPAATPAPVPSRTFATAPPPPSLEMIFRAAESTGCRWMSGDPRELSFCGEVAVRGKSYCEIHWARCYRPFSPSLRFQGEAA